MSPEHGADERVDWAAARASRGVDFPEDYRAFMALYGSGSISDEAEILAPALVGTTLVSSMADTTADAGAGGSLEGRPRPGHGRAEQVSRRFLTTPPGRADPGQQSAPPEQLLAPVPHRLLLIVTDNSEMSVRLLCRIRDPTVIPYAPRGPG
ncbi:hypothetical protein [Kitasatospora purpeofusca]|uniref:hypothetical protein n=1 Tax=Kitasatospora purpeofusca TaxID=67352 RepID=UPI003663FE76